MTYVPESRPNLDEVKTVAELETSVNEMIGHLKGKVIPKLAQIESTVQKRNRWLECSDRND